MQSFEVKYPKIETLLHWTNLSLMFDIKRSFSRGMEVYKTQKNELIDRWILHKQSYMFYREDICLQTLLLLFKYANYKNKRSFVSTTNEALVGILMTIGDVNNIFPISRSS